MWYTIHRPPYEYTMAVSIIIPTYNEEKIISHTLNFIKYQLKNYDYELIVSDDGSKDNTVPKAKHFKEPGKGIGFEHHQKRPLPKKSD